MAVVGVTFNLKGDPLEDGEPPDSNAELDSESTVNAIAEALRAAKLDTLLSTRPKLIATANIGCLTHLQAGSVLPARHWIELIDAAFP